MNLGRPGIAAKLREVYFGSSHYKILFVVLTVLGIAVALQQFYIINVNSVTRYSLSWHIPFNLLYFWYWFIILPVMSRISRRLESDRRGISKWLIGYFLLPLALVLIHQVIASLVINLLLGYSDVQTLIYKRILRNPWLGIDFAIYLVIMVIVNVIDYRRKAELNEARLDQLSSKLVRSQLNALECQLQPHFLFNTLNALSTLILKRDNSEARRIIGLLEYLLRATLSEDEKHEISLAEELRFVDQYLEIEKVRFGGKLNVRELIGPGTLDAAVPAFVLQPIIENAIRHGIAHASSRGSISFTSTRRSGNLSLVVEDNGPGICPDRKEKFKEGVGLRITRERLACLYGENQFLEMENVSPSGLRVRIVIPFVRMSERRAADEVDGISYVPGIVTT